jgi:hypothetical protein
MPRYWITFDVKQSLEGIIEVEADSLEAAKKGFDEGAYDKERLDAKLDLIDSEDRISRIRGVVVMRGDHT